MEENAYLLAGQTLFAVVCFPTGDETSKGYVVAYQDNIVDVDPSDYTVEDIQWLMLADEESDKEVTENVLLFKDREVAISFLESNGLLLKESADRRFSDITKEGFIGIAQFTGAVIQ